MAALIREAGGELFYSVLESTMQAFTSFALLDVAIERSVFHAFLALLPLRSSKLAAV